MSWDHLLTFAGALVGSAIGSRVRFGPAWRALVDRLTRVEERVTALEARR